MNATTAASYTVDDVIAAGYNLEPLICKNCGSDEVVFLQYIGDGVCENCGEWQTVEEQPAAQAEAGQGE